MNLQQILETRALATPITQGITADDKTPVMVIQYVPALGTGGAAATITKTTGNTLTFTVGAAVPAGADAIGNSTGEMILTADAYDTMGEVVDYINGRQAWRAYLVASLRADLGSSLLNKTEASCIGANGLTIYGDTSTQKSVGLAISGEKFTSNAISGHVKDSDDECENAMYYGSFNVTCVSAPHLRYYTGAAGATETLITSSKLMTSATVMQEGEENFTEPFIQATRGERLIIRCISPSTAAPATSSPVLTLIGKTAVLRNNRIVDSINYTAG